VQEPVGLELSENTSTADSGQLTRADFLKMVAVTGGAAALGGVLVKGTAPSVSAATRSAAQDTDILNFLLLIEYYQAAFYEDAVTKGELKGDLARYAEVVGQHEKAHIEFLRKRLGSKARSEPTFDFGDATSTPDSFAIMAAKLEDVGLGAYIGQGANLTRKAVLQIGRIASVEGRHAAWIRDIRHEEPAPRAADAAITQPKVTSALQATGFLTGAGQ
jgi:Ferritin-like domain